MFYHLVTPRTRVRGPFQTLHRTEIGRGTLVVQTGTLNQH